MSDIDFYDIALEMLCSTSVLLEDEYDVIVHGKSKGSNSLKKFMTAGEHWKHKVRRSKEEQNIYCLERIAFAMEEYLLIYPAPPISKQKLYTLFQEWLRRIADTYNIEDIEEIVALLSKPIENDTALALIKALHEEGEKTKEDLAKELNVTEKTIQTTLRKLSPTLAEKKMTSPGEIRLGEQKLYVDIQCREEHKEKGKKYYKMENTMHPLVLQMNVMQLGVLLQSLQQSYSNEISLVTFGIALDIWGQLSDYGKKRLHKIFTPGNRDLKEFFEALEDEIQGNHIIMFKTEKELLEEKDVYSWDQALMVSKSGCTCDIHLIENGKPKVLYKKRIVQRDIDGECRFYAIPAGEEDTSEEGVVVCLDNLRDITI